MPMYQYRCDKCGKELEEFHKVDDRHNQVCPECKRYMQIMIQPSPIHVFKGFFHPNLDKKPVWISSKANLKEESDKRGMTSFY